MKNTNIVEITKQLICFKTFSTNHEELNNALNFVISLLNKNIKSQIFVNNQSNLLWATTKDFDNPDILLLCHIDVVRAIDKDFIAGISKKKIIGRGAFDMKGSLASMIATINSVKTDKTIQLLITSDEEIGGQSGSGWFFKSKKIIPKIAIVPDGTSIQELVLRQKGPIHLVVQVKGKQAHGSRPWEGTNPICKLINIIEEINKIRTATSNSDWLPTFTPTNFEAISSINQIPKSAKMTLDVRITKKRQLMQVKKIIEKHNGTIIKIFGDGIILNQKRSAILDKWATIVERITHKQVTPTTLTGASDARHLPRQTEIIVTRGVGGNAHGDNEWVDIQSLNQLTAITKLFINTL